MQQAWTKFFKDQNFVNFLHKAGIAFSLKFQSCGQKTSGTLVEIIDLNHQGRKIYGAGDIWFSSIHGFGSKLEIQEIKQSTEAFVHTTRLSTWHTFIKF